MGIGRKILQRMAELGITSRVQLADKMKGKVHPYTVGRWISGKSVPRGDSLIALAKALKISADLLLFDEGESSEKTKSLERMVSSIVKTELAKSPKTDENSLNSELSEFLKSKKIPKEDKDIIIAQVKRLLERYKEVE